MSVDGNRALPSIVFVWLLWGFFQSFTHSFTVESLNDQEVSYGENLCVLQVFTFLSKITAH